MCLTSPVRGLAENVWMKHGGHPTNLPMEIISKTSIISAQHTDQREPEPSANAFIKVLHSGAQALIS